VSGTLQRASSAAPWSLLAKLFRFVFSLVTSMLVVRLLLPEQYGVLAITRTTLAFAAALIGLGMGNALIRYLPERETKKAGSRRLLRLCGGVQAMGWIVFVLLAFALRGPIDRSYGSPIGTPLLAGIALLSGNLLFSLVSNSLTATFRTRKLAFLQGGLSAAILVLTVITLHLIPEERGTTRVIGVLAAASLPHLIIAIFVIPRLSRRLSPGQAPAERGRILRYAAPLAGIEVLNLITWRQSETLILGYWEGAEAAGIFDIAYRLPQLLLEFVPEAVWPLVLAAFVEVYTRDKKRIDEMVRSYFRLLFLLVTPVTLFGVLYGDLLIQVLYGPNGQASAPYARLFFLIFHISFFGTPYSTALYLIEKSWVNMVLALVFAVINVGLDLLLIPRYGLPGAIPPVFIAIAISPFLRAWAVRRFHGPIRIPWAFLGRAYAISAVMALLYPLRPYAEGPAGFAGLLAASAVLFLVALRLGRLFGPEERDLIERSNLPGKALLVRWLFVEEKSR